MHTKIEIYHIVHIDNLSSIIDDGCLYSDAEMREQRRSNVVIGMDKIKNRRLTLSLDSHPGLHVGECVPFYFCPRSPMLYLFDRGSSSEIAYRGGQEPIIHLVADLQRTVAWANNNDFRWAFTNSNAGSLYFDDYDDLSDLDKINWAAVAATYWSGIQDEKQAEFLVEYNFPWELIEEIGVYSRRQQQQVYDIIGAQARNLQVTVKRDWYY